MSSDEDLLNSHAETRLIRLAGQLLSRSKALEHRIMAIENAAHTCNCARVASEAVLSLLSQAAMILENMRKSTDIGARGIMSQYFTKILKQMDAVVSECTYDEKNLAKRDSIKIQTDENNGHGFSIDGIDMSSAGFGLKPFDAVNVSNAEIIDRIMIIEQAKNNLSAHSHSYMCIADMLKTHMKFARGLVEIFNAGSVQINTSQAGQEAISQILTKAFSGAPNSELFQPHSGNALENSFSPKDELVD